jgi:hypothetical protein
VQGWNKMPGTPVRLICVRWMACVTDADQATVLAPEWSGKGRYDPQVSMSNREITFMAADGSAMRIELR